MTTIETDTKAWNAGYLAMMTELREMLEAIVETAEIGAWNKDDHERGRKEAIENTIGWLMDEQTAKQDEIDGNA
jgi:hypothetical protein